MFRLFRIITEQPVLNSLPSAPVSIHRNPVTMIKMASFVHFLHPQSENPNLIDNLSMRLSLKCLIALTLCLSLQASLSAEAVLTLSPGSPGEDGYTNETPTTPMDESVQEESIQSNTPVKLNAERQGIPKAILFRQLQPNQYPQYEAKIKSTHGTLLNALQYLDSLGENKEASLQRLSAFSAEASLEWDNLQLKLRPEEKKYQSYRLMKGAVDELNMLTRFWISANRTRRAFRGSLRERQDDLTIIRQKREKIRSLLTQLKEQDELKRNLNAELPY